MEHFISSWGLRFNGKFLIAPHSLMGYITKMLNLSAPQQQVYQNQDELLKFFLGIEDFNYLLSGGTALARFYFHHRFSEDLDFFLNGLEYSFDTIEKYINQLRKSGAVCELVGRTDKKGLLKVASYTVIKDTPIKVDFIEDPFTGMWPPEKKSTESGQFFLVDSLDAIVYKKLFAMMEQWTHSAQVSRIKDLIDLAWFHEKEKSLVDFLHLCRKNHIEFDEEKLILIFASINAKKLEQISINNSIDTDFQKIEKTFQSIAKQLVLEGIRL